MVRRFVLLGLAGTAALAVMALCQNRWIRAQPAGNENGKLAKTALSPLPMDQVILFSSGVGYFQRQGEVEGNRHVDLSFPATDVNDLLKSLVLQDLGGGHINTISYDSPEPIERTLRSFALDLTSNPTFGQILNQARGQKIELTLLPTAAPATLAGVIVGMETQRQQVGKETMEVDVLNLNCAPGLRSVPISQVQSVQFLNPALENDFRRALEMLARSHDTQKKTVSLDCRGQGKRSVQVGYVVENPIWKTSYRLVLDKNGKCTLQGWAMVENTTDEDWNNVRMVLISGRPISYQMDLYQPLYIPRPRVEPDLFASLRPPTYSGALTPGGQLGGGGAVNLGALGALGLGGGLGGLGLGGGNQFGLQGGNMGFHGQSGLYPGNRYQQFGNLGGDRNVSNPGAVSVGGPSDREPEADTLAQGTGRLSYEELLARRKQQREAKAQAKASGQTIAGLDPTGSVTSAALAEDLGNACQYLIDQRISLPRQKSALLPIVSQPAEATKVSIYNEGIHNKHPLFGLKFKNTSKQHLMQGPMTVYEAGSYAGDARIMDLQPNEERLLSYAVDLGTEIKVETRDRIGPNMTVKFSSKDTSALANFKVRRTSTYLIKNRSQEDRVVILEHPIRSGWQLQSLEKPSERSRETYRFQVAVAAGKSVKQDVVEEQERNETVGLSSSEDRASHYPLGRGVEIRPVVKTSPEELASLKIVKGNLLVSYRVRESKAYFVQNTTDQERVFAIDHLVRPHWQRVDDKGARQIGPAVYSFKLAAEAGKTSNHTVLEEHTELKLNQPVKTISDPLLHDFLATSIPSPALRTTLEKIVAFSVQQTANRRQLADGEQQLRWIIDDQSRLRANLERVPQTSAAYKRYLEKFETQETEIEKLQGQIKQLQASVRQQQKEFDDYVAALNVE